MVRCIPFRYHLVADHFNMGTLAESNKIYSPVWIDHRNGKLTIFAGPGKLLIKKINWGTARHGVKITSEDKG